MKINKIYIPLLFFSCISIGVLIGGMFNFDHSNSFFVKNQHKTKLNNLIEFIDKEYVDEIQTDSIVDLTVNNILSNLDPHSVYLPKEEQKQESEIMKGDFIGIGINFYFFKDTVAVIQPIANGPAKKAGIKNGDRILYADNFKLFGKKIKNEILYKKLRGEEGTDVLLTVFRKSENRILKLKVNRQRIPIKSIDTYVMLDKKTGFIKINRFAETTGEEFRYALLNLKQKGLTSLIIDLRENGGGFLEKAAEVADEFLKDKELIVYTKNKKAMIEKTFATEEGLFENGEVYVLIDESSASASEIVAGAIQDNDRGVVVGRRSFGKGLVQREMNFEDGSAVRLTIARYYTPSGRSIQKPYKKGDSNTYHQDFESRFESGELYEKDKMKIADSLKFKTKKGRIVYGGGGIVPDVFVPLEVNHGQESLEYILKSGIVSHFVFEQLDKSKKKYEGLSYSKFLEKRLKEVEYLLLFQKYLQENGLELDLSQNKEVVNRYITAELAGQLYEESKYYEILLKEDKMIKAILK